MGIRKRIVLATAFSAVLLVPLAIFGGSSFAHGFASAWQYGHHHGSGGSQYQYGKVTICHHTHSQKHPFVTITVGARAAKFLVAHGDTVGACPGQPQPPFKHHGDDDDQGEHHRGNDKGNTGAVVGVVSVKSDSHGHGGEGHGGGHHGR